MPKKVKHKVEDIEKWKAEHLNIDAERKKHGVTSSSWKVDPNDPKTIIVTHDVKDHNKQKEFRKSQKGRDQRNKAKANDGEDLE
jgi:hypothetical protein